MDDKGMMEIAKGYNKEDLDSMYNELEREYMLAQADYIRKKRLKGEKVDDTKMHNAINNRKKVRSLCKKCLYTTLGMGLNFLQEAKQRDSSA